jgi:hypothetical protein
MLACGSLRMPGLRCRNAAGWRVEPGRANAKLIVDLLRDADGVSVPLEQLAQLLGVSRHELPTSSRAGS